MTTPTTNEPSTPTPRMDKLVFDELCNFDVLWEEHCRTLETELAAAKANTKTLTKHIINNHKINKTIDAIKMELAAAKSDAQKWREIADMLDKTFHSRPSEHWIVALNKYEEAKKSS